MSKTAFDFIKEKANENAKRDSSSAVGWEAIDDLASLKLNVDFEHYFIEAVLEYLKTQPYPVEESK